MAKHRPSPGRYRTFKRTLAVFVVALLAFAVGFYALGKYRAHRYGNLIVIVVDTLRSDHMSNYGYERNTTPHIAEIAKSGIQFQGYSASSWTKSSITTLMSGLYPQRHQTFGYEDKLPSELLYLPSYLSERGYDTRAYNSNGHLGPLLGFDRGYRTYQLPTENQKSDAVDVTDAALALARKLKPPFLLYLHYLDPHDPYLPEEPWGRQISDEQRVQPRDIVRGRAEVNPETLGILRDLYDGEIVGLDREIGRLFAQLEELGVLDEKTLVVLTADHGEEFGEHGQIAHAKSLHAETIEVPFLLWRKDLAGYRSDVGFHHVDFLPTALEAMKVPIPADIDGQSRWPEIVSQTLDNDNDFFFHIDLDEFAEIGMLSWPRKLLHRRGTPTNLMFDKSQDPGEQTNRIDDTPESESMLRRLLEQHNQQAVGALERTTTVLEGDVKEDLVALGYIDESFASEEVTEHKIEDQLSYFDHRRLGLFGGHDVADFDEVVELRRPSQQLLGSWATLEETDSRGGRWSGSSAAIVLATSSGRDELILVGVSEEVASVELTISVDGARTQYRPSERTVEPGPFELRIPVPAELRSLERLYVEISVANTERGVFMKRAFLVGGDGGVTEAALAAGGP